MSAWIVSRKHIDVLVHGITRRELVSGLSPDEIGRALWEANVVAIEEHYLTDHYSRAMKGLARKYTYRGPVEGVSAKACHMLTVSYEYQTGEAEGYEGSFAGVTIRALLDAPERPAGREGNTSRNVRHGDPEYAWSI